MATQTKPKRTAGAAAASPKKKVEAVPAVQAVEAPPVQAEVKVTIDKSNNPDYVLNPTTQKYVKSSSAAGKKILNGEVVPVKASKTEVIINIIKFLQVQYPDITDDSLKTLIRRNSVVVPRDFPEKWGGPKLKLKDRPKKAKTSYNIFSSENRNKIRDANPGVPNNAPKNNPNNIPTLMKLIGEEWAKLSPEQMQYYIDKAVQDKLRYAQDLEKWYEVHPEQRPVKKDRSIRKVNGWTLYGNEQRAKFSEFGPDSAEDMKLSKRIGADWLAMPEAEKEVYKTRASEINLANGFVPPTKPLMSAKEEAKMNDPEHYELNDRTGKYVKKRIPKPRVRKTAAAVPAADAAVPVEPVAVQVEAST